MYPSCLLQPVEADFFSHHETHRWDGAFLCFKRIVADKSYNNMKAPPRAA